MSFDEQQEIAALRYELNIERHIAKDRWEILQKRKAEIEQLKRDVAGQNRSAQNGWFQAEKLRVEVKQLRAEVDRLVAAYDAQVGHARKHYERAEAAEARYAALRGAVEALCACENDGRPCGGDRVAVTTRELRALLADAAPETPAPTAQQPVVVVLHTPREWTCPHCGASHRCDHDIPDLANLECSNCDRVTLGRVIL